MVIMGMGNKEIIQRSAFQGVFDILYCSVGAMGHTAIKQGGIFIPNKKIALACFVRDAVNVPVHILIIHRFGGNGYTAAEKCCIKINKLI